MKTREHLSRGELPPRRHSWKPGDRARCLTYAVAAIDVARVKVGRTAHWEDRWAKLTFSSPVELTLLAVAKGDFERRLHAALMPHHSHGEWFVFNLETRTIIALHLEAETLGLQQRQPPMGKLRGSRCKVCGEEGHYAKTCVRREPRLLTLSACER